MANEIKHFYNYIQILQRKLAAGQAIQNMKLVLGLPETTGLKALAVYP